VVLPVFACCLCTNVQEVQQREEIVARKEAVLAEKRELEMKKLRSSQVLNKVQHLSGHSCFRDSYRKVVTNTC